MIELNILKPVNKYQKQIAKKCGWANADSMPLRKNILPDGFVGSAELEAKAPIMSKNLSPNNAAILNIIMNNDKIARSPFVRANMTPILDMSKDAKDFELIKKILTPENVDKLDNLRALVKRHPSDYIKDKTQVKYINTPAGLNALFNDVAMLKASQVLDFEGLNTLFKLDVTQGQGKKLLDIIGKCDDYNLDIAKKGAFKKAVIAAYNCNINK